MRVRGFQHMQNRQQDAAEPDRDIATEHRRAQETGEVFVGGPATAKESSSGAHIVHTTRAKLAGSQCTHNE